MLRGTRDNLRKVLPWCTKRHFTNPPLLELKRFSIILCIFLAAVFLARALLLGWVYYDWLSNVVCILCCMVGMCTGQGNGEKSNFLLFSSPLYLMCFHWVALFCIRCMSLIWRGVRTVIFNHFSSRDALKFVKVHHQFIDHWQSIYHAARRGLKSPY